jgi:hypothetical protein
LVKSSNTISAVVACGHYFSRRNQGYYGEVGGEVGLTIQPNLIKYNEARILCQADPLDYLKKPSGKRK